MAWTRGERIRVRSLVAVLIASASLPRLPAATQTVAYLEYLARFSTYRRAHSMRCITDWYDASFSSTWQPRESPLWMNGQYFSFPDDNLHDGIYLMFISFEQCSLDSSGATLFVFKRPDISTVDYDKSCCELRGHQTSIRRKHHRRNRTRWLWFQ